MNLRRANRRLPRRRLDVPLELLNYKNPELLSRFTSETGKLLPRRVTGVPAWLHRKITREVKRARALNLLA
jgi:small subunit ribosomal protein S18